MTDHKLGVHSEAGQLRQVIVSPLGLAHRRLTPDNREDLLFDDVFWLKQAIKDHAVFADIMRDEGVEVLDAMVLLAETLAPQAVGQLAEALFEGGDVHRVIACQMPSSRAAMHLDTVFTHCGGDVVTTFKEVADAITCYDLRAGSGDTPLDIRRDSRHLFEITAEILGHKKLHLVPTGGSDAAEQSREQWNDGNNVLALRLGVVIDYDRNDETNAALKDAGINVLAIPGAELGRGRGSSHCMSCPTIRDEI